MTRAWQPKFSQVINQVQRDPLLRNSVLLMLSSIVQAVFGFGFWVLCARLFKPEEVGIGGALISAVNFISYVSLLGLNSALIRFLPASTCARERNAQINTALLLVLLCGLLVSGLYLALLPSLSSELAFIREHPTFASLLLLLSAFSAVNLLTDSIFVAFRAAHLNLLVYSIQSLLKLAFPLLLAGLGGVGIFTATGAAASVALLLSLHFAARHLNYTPALAFDRTVLEQVWKFSFANYVANLINILPIMLVPLIVLNNLGAEANGHYYLAFTISNLLYAVSYAVSQSLFAEGAHGQQGIRPLFVKALSMMLLIMVPSSALIALAGRYILLVFGKSYSAEASQLLTILTLSAPVVGLYVLCTSLLRVTGQTASLIVMNLIYAALITGLSFLWRGHLSGMGWAWLAGNLLAALYGFLAFSRAQARPTPTEAPARITPHEQTPAP